jgi:hypothetical protein
MPSLAAGPVASSGACALPLSQKVAGRAASPKISDEPRRFDRYPVGKLQTTSMACDERFELVIGLAAQLKAPYRLPNLAAVDCASRLRVSRCHAPPSGSLKAR